MNIKLNFNEQFDSIDVIYPINYSDRLDGLSDTISCEFYLNDDLLPYYHKHQKIVIDVLDDNNTILKQFRMCATDLNRELCSTYSNNSAYTYRYTLTACEPTVLINENIRTDIAITPAEYSKTKNPYKTLWDAYYKICSCHNLNNRNEPIYNNYFNSDDNTVVNDTYTYSYRLTATANIGTITYWDSPVYPETGFVKNATVTSSGNGTAITIALDIYFNSACTNYLGTYLMHISYDFNNNTIITDSGHEETIQDSLGFAYSVTVDYTVTNYLLEWFLPSGLQLHNFLTSVPCPLLTYQDLSTYSQLEDVFSRVGIVPYLDFDELKRCYVTFYMLQGNYENDNYSTIEVLSNEEKAKLNDYTANSVSAQVKNISCDMDTITFPSKYSQLLKSNNYADEITTSLSQTFANEQNGIYITNDYTYRELTMLVPNTYDQEKVNIQEPNQYYLELPTNIENILYMYYIVPSGQDSTQVTLKKIDMNRIIEHSMWENLPALTQKSYGYFVRGDNKIKQPVALLASLGVVDGDWSWSQTQGYSALRKARFICVYKPMIDLSYTYYTFNNLDDKTTKNIDLPYKAISDKQVSNLLAYEYEKQTSNKISYKLITKNINDVVHNYAGKRIYYKTRRFNDSDLFKYNNEEIFPSLETLSYYTSQISVRILYGTLTKNSFAKVQNGDNVDYYVIDEKNFSWKRYIGDSCVITKMDVVINRNSIEVSYELNTNIAQGSIVTGYSDNVRVSDNLSTETVVNREINIYKTFLLNCTATQQRITQNEVKDVLAPSISLPNNPELQLYNKNKFFLNGIDNMLLASGLANMKCFDCSNANYISDTNKLNRLGLFFEGNEVGASDANTSLLKINKTPTEITRTATQLVDDHYFTDMRSYIYNFISSTNNRIYLNKISDDEYVFENVFYFSTPSVNATGTNVSKWFFVPNASQFIINDVQIIDFVDKKSYFYYTVDNYSYDPTDTSTGPIIKLKYHDWELTHSTSQSNDETISTWNLHTEALVSPYISGGNLDVYIGFGTLPAKETRPVNTSPIFIHSNNVTSMVFNQESPCVIGNYVTGYDSAKWVKSKPLFYKYSFINNKLSGIHGKNCNYSNRTETDLSNTMFDVLVRNYGFEDLYIDMREKISVIIHYIVIPNNYNEFYRNNFGFLFNHQYIPTEGERYPSNSTFSAKILELNTNIDWLNNIITSTTKTGSLIFKRVPKNVSMTDYLINNTNYDTYSTAVGELKSVPWQDLEFGFQRDYYALVTSSSSLTDNNNIYNYVLINKEQNGNEIPLMIIDTEGCVFPNNQICLSYFLI